MKTFRQFCLDEMELQPVNLGVAGSMMRSKAKEIKDKTKSAMTMDNLKKMGKHAVVTAATGALYKANYEEPTGIEHFQQKLHNFGNDAMVMKAKARNLVDKFRQRTAIQ